MHRKPKGRSGALPLFLPGCLPPALQPIGENMGENYEKVMLF